MVATDGRVRVMRIIARMNVGGPAVQVSGLMRHLDAQRFNQRLLTGYCSSDEADYLETQAPDVIATRVRGLGRSISLLEDLRAFAAIRREVRSFRPDVVHTHTAKAGVLGRLAAVSVRPRPRLVHTFHGHLLHGYFGRLGTSVLILVERILANFTDVLVAVGPEVRNDLITAGIGSADKFHVVEPGLELNENPEPAAARLALGVARDRPVISVLGRITGIKRPDRMLDVVASVQAQIPNVLVLVAGAGDLFESTQEAAVSARLPINFLGWRNDVEVILAASDVTLLTSDNEGTPLSIIQAALLGVPAVCTDVGSVRHIVHNGDTGWVCNKDTSTLALSVIEALQNDAERRRRGEAARNWATSHYSVKRLAENYGAIYLDSPAP